MRLAKHTASKGYRQALDFEAIVKTDSDFKLEKKKKQG